MQTYTNLNRVMEFRNHFKNEASLKSLMSKGNVLLIMLLFLVCPYSWGQGNNKIDKAIIKYNRCIDNGFYKESERAEEALAVALAYKEQKNYDKAIEWYNKALTHFPNYARSLLELGIAYHEKADCEQAISYYQKSLSNSGLTITDKAGALASMANCYIVKGDTTEALRIFEESLQIKRIDFTLNSRGYIYFVKGEIEKSVADYKEAMDLGWKSDSLADWLANYYWYKENYEEAYKYKNKVENKTGGTYCQLAQIAYKLNKLEETDKYFNESLKFYPSLDADLNRAGNELAKEARQASQKFVAEKQEKERQRQAELERQRQAAEANRKQAIKNAGIGEKLLYSESWQWREGIWIFETSGSYTMMVTCFIERIEGDRYQLRVGDVKSSSYDRYKKVTINGVDVSKGDIIWAKPLNDGKWVYGE